MKHASFPPPGSPQDLGARLMDSLSSDTPEEDPVELINKGAVLNLRDTLQRTALILAIDRGNDAAALALLEKGALLDARDRYGNTALTLAINLIRPDSLSRRSVVRAIIGKNATLDMPDGSGETPLYIAISKNLPDIARSLIDRGVNVSVQGQYGETPLMWAALYDDVAMVRLLLDKGADIYTADNVGCKVFKYTNGEEASAVLQERLTRDCTVTSRPVAVKPIRLNQKRSAP